MKWFLLLIVLSVWYSGEGWSQDIDIPLTVRETAGLARHQYPITSGVPLPRGLLKSARLLQLMDRRGRFVPAVVREVARWPEDGSLQWIQVHFAASLPANGQVEYFLRPVGGLPRFPSPIGLSRHSEGVEVVTGPLRLVMGGASQQLLDQVWVDENWGYDFSARTRILDSGRFRMVLKSGGKTYGMGSWSRNRVEVEEANAFRAVIKVSGTFVSEDAGIAPLDYVARVTVYGGKTFFKLGLTLVRPCGTGTGEFPVEDFSLETQLNLDPLSRRFALGGGDRDHQGHFDRTSTVSLYLDGPDSYRLSVVETNEVPPDGDAGRETVSRTLRRRVARDFRSNLGWADLSDERHGLAVGVKQFRHLFPKAFEIKKSGSLIVRLFPDEAEPWNLPAGGSRTHQMLFYFHGDRSLAQGRVRNELMGLQKPVYAFASPSWYCRAGQALGPLSESSPEVYREGFWPLVRRVDGWIQGQRESLAESPDIGGADDINGHRRLGSSGGRPRPESAKTTAKGGRRTDDRSGSLAHGLYLHFFRTGDPVSLEVAEQLVDQWVDPGVSRRSHPASRACAPSGWDGHGREPLLYSFLLTGNRRALDAARSWLDRVAVADEVNPAQAPRHAAAVLVGLVRGYQALGDERYLEKARWIVDVIRAWQDGDWGRLKELSPVNALRWQAEHGEASGAEDRDRGQLWSALHRNRDWLGRDRVEACLRREIGSVRVGSADRSTGARNPGKSPEAEAGLASGLAALYETGGDPRHWELALRAFTEAMQDREASRSVPSGAISGEAQHFLWYLSRAFDPPR
ncbi:MAG: hypothetical protein OXU26_09780 [Acidobacteriota bacterium]|nr:hypothetical protein [Acidobacteriota bacterium]